MAFCPKCGKSILEDSAFCGACGTRVKENEAPKAPVVSETPVVSEAPAVSETVEVTETPVVSETVEVTETPVVSETVEVTKTSENTENTENKDAQINTEEIFEKGKQFVGNVTEAAKNVNVNGLIERAKAGDKKVIGAGIGIAAGVVVAFVVFVLLISSLLGGGYMSPIKNYVKMMNKKSTDYFAIQKTLKGSKLAKADKDIIKAYIAADAEIGGDSAKDYYEDREEDQIENLEDRYDDILDEYKKFKLTFDKKKAKKMDKDDLKEATENINDYYEDVVDDYEDMLDDEDELETFGDNYDTDEKGAKKIIKAQISQAKQYAKGKFTAGYEVKGRFIVKVDGKEEYKTESITLYVVKFNGEWVYTGCDGSLYFDLDGDDEAEVLQSLLSNIRNGGIGF